MVVRYGSNFINNESGQVQSDQLSLALPVLGKISCELLPPEASSFNSNKSFHLWENGNTLFGFTKIRIGGNDLKETANTLDNQDE